METRLNNGGSNNNRKIMNSDQSGFTHSSFVMKAIKFIFRQLNVVMCNTVMKYSLSVGSHFKTLGGAGDLFTETSFVFHINEDLYFSALQVVMTLGVISPG